MKVKLIVFFILVVFMAGCNSVKRHNYVLLIDNSKTISNETFEKYLNIIEEIIPKLGKLDCITIQFIDECTLTKAERVFNFDLSAKNFSCKSDGMNNEKDSVLARVKRFLMDSIQVNIRDIILTKRLERKDCGNYTDIINALNEATSLLNKSKSYTSSFDEIKNEALGNENFEYENVLVIFSDMVNENRDKTMDFTQLGKFNEKKIADKIDELHKLNKVPDFSNCSIFVYGATSTPEAGAFANKQIENCKLFWQTYFKDCGAELVAYSFDSQKEISEFMISNNY